MLKAVVVHVSTLTKLTRCQQGVARRVCGVTSVGPVQPTSSREHSKIKPTLIDDYTPWHITQLVCISLTGAFFGLSALRGRKQATGHRGAGQLRIGPGKTAHGQFARSTRAMCHSCNVSWNRLALPYNKRVAMPTR